jgi:hypothetical protein
VEDLNDGKSLLPQKKRMPPLSNFHTCADIFVLKRKAYVVFLSAIEREGELEFRVESTPRLLAGSCQQGVAAG